MATKTEKMTPTPLNTPAPMASREADAGLGFENFNKSKDLKIPFLQIVQGLSPELKRTNPKYIEGAEQGDIFNNVTRKLYKMNGPDVEPVKIIPITHIRVHNEWVKRTLKGGYVKTYPDGMQPETTEGMDGNRKVKELVSSKDHCLVETVMHDVYVMDEEEGAYEAIISMAGSNLGPSRDFTSKLFARKEKKTDGTRYTPAFFDNVCALSTVLKPFPDGECYVFRLDLVGRTLDAQYSETKQLHAESKDRLALMAPSAATLGIEDKEEVNDEKTPY